LKHNPGRKERRKELKKAKNLPAHPMQVWAGMMKPIRSGK